MHMHQHLMLQESKVTLVVRRDILYMHVQIFILRTFHLMHTTKSFVSMYFLSLNWSLYLYIKFESLDS